MTEQEAVEIVRKEKAYMDSHAGKAQSEAFEMAIKALEEIRQYRALGLTPELIEAMQGHNIAMINDLAEYQALGTVEELKSMKENGAFTGLELAQLAAMQMRLRKYETIGTVEELKVAKEFYDSINKIEDDIWRMGMGCDDLRERIKQIYKQFRGKV